MIQRLFCAVAMLITVQQACGASDSRFAEANGAYAAGDLEKAIEGYDELVRDGRRHANLFYDLANAWYRGGDDAKTILNYQRALALEPHHPEAGANLRLVREHARALELQPRPLERYFGFTTTRALTITAAVAFWFAVFLAISFVLSRSRLRVASIAFALLVFGIAAFGAYLGETGVRGRSLAIVIAKDTQARVATADASPSVLALPAGSEVMVLTARGDWTYVALPNDQRGWLPAKTVELVRL